MSDSLKLHSLIDLEKEICERSLADFTVRAFPTLEPGTDYKHNWHIDAMSEHLEAVFSGQIKKLLINIPFRCMKSIEVCVMFPSWCWIHRPELRFLSASYAEKLALRDSVKTRTLIESNWFQKRWGDKFSLTDNKKEHYGNDKGGYRITTSVGGTATGEGGDIRLLDDPHKAGEIYSETIRKNVITWVNETWASRYMDPKDDREVVVMQRLGEKDVSGEYLKDGGYVHLMLPMEYEPKRKCYTILGWEDPRKTEGELLFPDRFGKKELAAAKKKLGTYGTSGQLQQDPTPQGGGIIKTYWWRFWYPKDVKVIPKTISKRDENGDWHELNQIPLPELNKLIQSWDLTFKDKIESDYVVGQILGKDNANMFLADQIRDKMNFPRACSAVKTMTKKHPKATAKYIEDKANGPALISTMKDSIPGLIPVNPEGGKIARTHAMSPFVESGNVYLPHPEIFPWVNDLIKEFEAFPNGENDDQVDTLSQGINQLTKTTVTPNARSLY